MHAAQVDLHCGWLEEILVGREEGARCFEEVRRLLTQDVCLLAHGHKAPMHMMSVPVSARHSRGA